MAFDKEEIKQLRELFKENNKAIADAMAKGFESIEAQLEEVKSELGSRIDHLEQKVDGLEQKVDEGFERVQESLIRKNRQGYNHEQRLIKLEKIHPKGRHIPTQPS